MNIETIDVIEIQDEAVLPSESGRKQWEILQALIEKYNKKDISKITSSGFMEDTWAYNDTRTINWRKYLPSEDYLPMEIFLKIFLIHSIQIWQVDIQTVVSRSVAFLINVVPHLAGMSKPILIAKSNQPWMRLDSLTVDDISFLLQSLFIKEGGLTISHFINDVERGNSFPDLECFCKKLLTPWTFDNIYREKWVDNLKATLDIEVKEKKPYSALHDDVVSGLVNAAIPYLEGISTSLDPDDLFEKKRIGNKTLLDLMRTIKKEKLSSKGKSLFAVTSFLSKNKKIQNLFKEHEDYFTQTDFSPESYRLTKGGPSIYFGRISQDWWQTFFVNARNAAMWIVLLTTGLRNTDLRNLKAENLLYSDKYEVWFLKSTLKKTKSINYIPIGEPTVKAIKLLKWFGLDSPCDELIQTDPFIVDESKKSSKKLYKGDSINRYLKDFATRHGITLDTVSDDDDEGTCHCVRATLGAYIGRTSIMANLILKVLFGHTNYLMPDQYVRHNPYVQKFRAEQLQNMHSQTSKDIAKAIVNKKISGPKAVELSQGIAHLEKTIKLENESLNEIDTHQKLIDILSEIILADIVNEQTQTLLTPLGVICMRASNRTDSSPCAAHTDALEREKAGVSRSMFNAIPSLPNPAKCMGNGCPDALMTEKHSMPLLKQFDWYSNVLRTCTDTEQDMDEDARNFVATYYPIVMANDMLTEASEFVKKYGNDLRILYADKKPEGYFDA